MSTTVDVVRRPTVLSVSGPAGSVARSAPYVVSGTLTASGDPVAGAAVTLTRTDLAGTRTIDVTTSGAGAFTYQDTPAVGGTVTWRAAYAGSSSDMPATGTRKVAVARTSTVFGLAVDHTVVPYGSPLKVTVRLGKTYNSRTVSVYARKANSSTTTRIKTLTVGSSGVASFAYTPTAKTVLSATFAGDYRFAPASATHAVNVTSRVTMTVRRATGRSGTAYVMPRDGDVLLTASILPARTSGCASFEFQLPIGGVWRTTSGSACSLIYSQSKAISLYVPHGYVGMQRVRLSVKATTYSGAGTSAWVYLKSV